MKYRYPNYNCSTLSLINSILSYYKVKETENTLNVVDNELKKTTKM